MKKFLAAGLSAIMVFSLTACGGSKTVSLTGTWKGSFDATEVYGESFDSGFDSEDIKFSEYIPEMTENITLVLNEDNTYTVEMTTDVDIAAFQDGYVQYLTDTLTAENGGTPYTDEELIEWFGTADLKEATAEFFTDEEMDELFGAQNYDGAYTEENGTVTFDEDITGTFDGKTLSVDLSEFGYGTVTFTKAQ